MAKRSEGRSEGSGVDFPLSNVARVDNEIRVAHEEVLTDPDAHFVMHLTWVDKKGGLQHRTWRKAFGNSEDLQNAVTQMQNHIKT